MANTSARNVFRTFVISASLTPTSVSTVTTSEQTFTVPGLLPNDMVVVSPPARTVNASLTGWRVSDANTLALTFTNPTAGSVTPTAGVYEILVFR